LPINWIPIGNPLVSKPQGILIAGRPAKLAGTVNRSDKYIESGSLTKSPFKKAVVGQVGVNKTSTFLKALSKSYLISVLTFCAFL